MSFSANYPLFRPSLNLNFARAKVLDPRVTFARASTATYYDGVTTAKAEENLLLQSQDFTTTWSNTRSTDSANTDTAPDGTVTADSVLQATGETSGGFVSQTVSVTATDYVISVFAKPNGKNFLRIVETLQTGSTVVTFFDVQNGTVGTTGSGHTATITASTNSYYRCSIKFTANAARSGSVILGLADADNSTVVVDSGGLYLWGAQLEQRSSVTSYTPTTTQPITNYVPVLQTAANNIPRFDHNPATNESLGLLIEESRTNLITYSEDISNAAWTKSNVSITANTVISPDGMLSADLIVPDTSNISHAIQYPNITANTTTTSTVSFFVKKAGYTTIHLRYGVQSTANRGQADINLVTGAVTNLQNVGTATGSSCSVTTIGNDWWRVALSVNPNDAAATQTRLLIYPNVSTAYAGDGYSGIYIWGAQLEAGDFLTSYIATGAATATRSADAASMIGPNFSSWYNQSEGTLYGEAATLSTGYNAGLATLSDGTLNNRITIRGMNTSSQSAFLGVLNTVAEWTLIFTSQTTSQTKFAVGYKVNDIAFTRNAATPLTDTAALIPVVNQLRIGADGNGLVFYNGYLRRIAYYPLRLTNAQLQALTS